MSDNLPAVAHEIEVFSGSPSSGFDVTRWITQNVVPLAQIAERFADSGLVPAPLAKKPAAVFTVLATGVELGLGPAAALRSIHVVEGRACLSADLMIGLAMSAGASFEYIQNDIAGCVINWRRGGSHGRASFTMDDAKRAGLATRANWQKYPAAMCAARAKAAAARQAAPDRLTGIYTPDEIQSTAEAVPEHVESGASEVAPTAPAPSVTGPPTPAAPLGVEMPPEPPKPPVAKSAKSASERQSARLWALAGELKIQGRRQVDGQERSVIYLGSETIDGEGAVTFKRDEELMGAAGMSGCPYHVATDGPVYVVGKALNDEQIRAFADRLQPLRDKRVAMKDAEEIGL